MGVPFFARPLFRPFSLRLQIETSNNTLGPISAERLEKLRDLQKEGKYTVNSMMEMVRLDQEDQKSTGLLNAYVKDKGSLTEEQSIQLAGYVQAYFYEIASKYGQEFARGAVEDLLSGGARWEGESFPYAGTSEQRDAAALAAGYGFFNTRSPSENERLYNQAVNYLRDQQQHIAHQSLGGDALYFLGGGLGGGIRVITATDGALQMFKGGAQALDADLWNASGNIVFGLMKIGSLGTPKIGGTIATAGGSTKSVSLPAWFSYGGGLDESLYLRGAVQDRAYGQLLDEIQRLPSRSKASSYAMMIGAYEPVSGKIAVGYSNAEISAATLHPTTVSYIERKLGVEIGSFTSFCKNKVGACAEVSAADSLVRQGIEPSKIKFTEALRPREVWGKSIVKDRAVVKPCDNCSVTWP
nr:hypothetical protein [Pseudomonas sp.]